eukprot:5073191-Pleurochrysis_carterae.AAC.3
MFKTPGWLSHHSSSSKASLVGEGFPPLDSSLLWLYALCCLKFRLLPSLRVVAGPVAWRGLVVPVIFETLGTGRLIAARKGGPALSSLPWSAVGGLNSMRSAEKLILDATCTLLDFKHSTAHYL